MTRQTSSICIPPSVFGQFRKEMLAARHSTEEVIGFLLCEENRITSTQTRWVAKERVVPDCECYERQSAGGIVLRQEFHRYLLDECMNRHLRMAHVHTHPGSGRQQFSGIDDTYESEYIRFLRACKGQPAFASGVYDANMTQGNFRKWTVTGNKPLSTPMKHHTAWLRPDTDEVVAHAHTNAVFDRQRVFGRGFQEKLAQLTIGLIGCGGIGAPFAEQLSRLGVRNWVLIDPDQIEISNLNRLPFSTRQNAHDRTWKVRHVGSLIRRLWNSECAVRCFHAPIESRETQCALGTCDVVVIATDNHSSRLMAQELCLRWAIPLLSLATQIDIGEGQSQPRIFSQITAPPLGGGWCLMCADKIDVRIAAMEQRSQSLQAEARAAGYLSGVAAPAVYWVNSITAAYGVSVIHGAATGHLNLDAGLDWVLDLQMGKWHKLSHDMSDTCYYCGR